MHCRFLQLILQTLKEERGECSMEYLRKLNDEVRLCLLQAWSLDPCSPLLLQLSLAAGLSLLATSNVQRHVHAATLLS